jgi:hypothetical protein
MQNVSRMLLLVQRVVDRWLDAVRAAVAAAAAIFLPVRACTCLSLTSASKCPLIFEAHNMCGASDLPTTVGLAPITRSTSR